ncbi:MAG: glycosyltransferase family 39 protein [Candidatus Methylacidiphilales bacterium]
MTVDEDRVAAWILVKRWRVYAVLALLALALLGPGTATLPLIDRDEPRFAGATREMMTKGEWVVPYFNGEFRFDKPILIYWLMRISIGVFGDGEWAVRFPSIVFAAATAWVIYEWGRGLGRAGAGALGGAIWLSSFQVLIHGRLAVADMPMVFFVALAQLALWQLISDSAGRGRFWFWILWISLGLGFLAKGPIALAVPLGSALIWRWVFWRQSAHWKRLRPGLGLLVMLGVMSVWGIPALVATGGLFWKVGMGEHVIARGTEAFNERSFVLFYYLLTAPLSLLPWFGFAGYALGGLRQCWSSSVAFLAAWAVTPYLVFFAYSTQLPHYVMPGFPAFALLAGMGIIRLWESGCASRWANGWFWMFGFVVPLIVMIMGVTFMTLAQGEQEPELAWTFMGFAGAMVGLICFSMAARFRIGGVALVGLVILAVCQSIIGKKLGGFVPSASLENQGGGLARGYQEPSLVYYGGPVWTWRDEAEPWSDFLQAAREQPVAVALIQERRLEDWAGDVLPSLVRVRNRPPLLPEGWEAEAKEAGFKVERRTGVNTARVSWVEVGILRPSQR